VSRKSRNWYQNGFDEDIKGVDSRDKVKQSERSDRLLQSINQNLFSK